MKIAPYRLSVAAFLIGLGSAPSLCAQEGPHYGPPQIDVIENATSAQLPHPSLNVIPQNRNIVTANNTAPSTADLQHLDQTLQNDASQLQGDEAALQQDIQKYQSDQQAGSKGAAISDLVIIQAQRQTVANDRLTVNSDRIAANQMLQPAASVVRNDRTNLDAAGRQTLNDEAAGNSNEVPHDLMAEKSAKQKLRSDLGTLLQDRSDAGLMRVSTNTAGVATGVGNGTNIGGTGTVSGASTSSNGTSTSNTSTASSTTGATTSSSTTTGSTVTGPTIGVTSSTGNSASGITNPSIPTTSDTTGQVIGSDPNAASGTSGSIINAGTAASAGIGANGSVPASTGLPTGTTAVPASTGLPTTNTAGSSTNSASVPASSGLPTNPNAVGRTPPTAAQGATSGSRVNPGNAIAGGGQK